MRDALDLNTVRVYAAVVDEQSFAGASRLLAMPSSNVSRHVAALERRLGTRLLERSTRHLRMTEAGRLLYERAKPLLDTLLATQEELGAVQRELRGPLKMCMPGEAPRLLAPILAEFCSLHPGIELECDTRMTGLEVLREDVDLSIVFHRGHQEDSAFITRELATLPSIVVAAPSLLARTGMPRHVRELKSLPCITTLSALKGQPGSFRTLRAKSSRCRSVAATASTAENWPWQAQGKASASRLWRPIPARKTLLRADCRRYRWTCVPRHCNCWGHTAIAIP